KKPFPEIDPIYDADDSDEETTNTTGNVPKEWYDEFPHVGYSIDGKPIMRGEKGDQLDNFLSIMDDPNAWRSAYDSIEDKNVVLTKEELAIIKRIQSGGFPDAEEDPYQPTVEWFSSQTMQTALSAAPEPKRRFVPSKWEAQRIMHIVRAIRQGRIVPGKKPDNKPSLQDRMYDIWGDAIDPIERGIMHISAPKASLPEHDESYNPPQEYIPTEKEAAEWRALDAPDRPRNFLPRKHDNLRSVPGYDRFIQERFDRCLDLYLCPRIVKKKLNIDPDSLIPKLPNPRDLKPFPSQLAITFKGHSARVRHFSMDPSGQWLASASDDSSVKLWEIVSGRCVSTWKFDEPVSMVAWNPNKSVALLAVSVKTDVHFVVPPLIAAPAEAIDATEALVAHLWTLQTPTTNAACKWVKPATAPATSTPTKPRILTTLSFTHNVTHLTWHRKGDYLATVAADARSSAVLIHQLSKKQTQNPFSASKRSATSNTLVQRVVFHPSKPIFLVATQRAVRVYNLGTQKLVTTLIPSTKWISSLAVHPAGDNVLVGTYDKRVAWFDLDLSSKPYKQLRYHAKAVRDVAFANRYPLFASAADDGNVNVFHGMVYADLMMNPLIVPVKTLKAHDVVDGLGVLHVEFHPTQPWLLSSGADGTLKLFS
ncbi:NUC169 domain-containing protein, partial [Fimicolochytrium jonesii]|uniref:NUC169 domain-containing protein n=1 Tax=Fimicolochytrium jonesii TaxID=1396493 RepID=UPI0022FF1A26